MCRFRNECEHLKRMFLKLKYPLNLINSTIASFTNTVTRHCDEIPTEAHAETQRTVRIVLPFKDRKSADAVRKQLKDLSKKIERELQPVYTSPKIGDKLKLQEKPALVKHQCVVCIFKCDLYDADYMGYTIRHLHQRTEEHTMNLCCWEAHK